MNVSRKPNTDERAGVKQRHPGGQHAADELHGIPVLNDNEKVESVLKKK